MTELKLTYSYFPTLRQLLETEALAEAQVLTGDHLLERVVSQVVSNLSAQPRADSLFVSRIEAIGNKEHGIFRNLAGVVMVRPGTIDGSSSASGIISAAKDGTTQASLLALDPVLKDVHNLCSELSIPLLAIPSFGDSQQVVEDVRSAHLKEVKINSSRLHAQLLKVVMSEGLEGLVSLLSTITNRPIVIESPNFQVLASANMGQTPINQQPVVVEQTMQVIARAKKRQINNWGAFLVNPLKIGRRLVLPVLLEDTAVGYLSTMTKAGDSLEVLAEYLQSAASAATIDFYQQRRDSFAFAVTQKSLLKDLLSGRTLSASDQERIERHYGFDLADGLLVFAVATVSGEPIKSDLIADETWAMAEVEGTLIFVLPYNEKDGKTWQELATKLINHLKTQAQGAQTRALKIQLGAGRLASNILGLSDAYLEARQALIIGSMIQGKKEFVTGYGDLGIKRLIYLLIDHPEVETFYEENLAPLERYDAEWESELVASLRVYLDQGANLNSAARALFIHRHTLRYRLEQIAEILKVDIDSQEILLNLQVAFLIKDIKYGLKGARP